MRAGSVPLLVLAGIGVGLVLGAALAPGIGLPPAAAPPGTTVRFTASGDYSASSEAESVLAQVARLKPDLHLALGDLSYGEPGEEATWCEMVTTRVGSGFPFELIAGNHESDGRDGNINDFAACLPNQLPGLQGTYGRQWYVDVPEGDPVMRIVAISPDLDFENGTWRYREDSTRYAWTAGAIDGARAAGIPWVVVAMHKPCLSVGRYDCSIADIANLLVERRVDLVLTGHEHNYMRTHQLAFGRGCTQLEPGTYNASCIADRDSAMTRGGGTVFATVGTGGMPLRSVDPGDSEARYFAALSGSNDNATWGNLLVTVDDDTLTAQFQRARGGTYSDSFTIEDRPDPDAAAR